MPSPSSRSALRRRGGDDHEQARDAQVLADRDVASIAHLREALDEREPILVPLMDADVHDVAGLVAVQRHLFAPAADRERLLADAAGA